MWMRTSRHVMPLAALLAGVLAVTPMVPVAAATPSEREPVEPGNPVDPVEPGPGTGVEPVPEIDIEEPAEVEALGEALESLSQEALESGDESLINATVREELMARGAAPRSPSTTIDDGASTQAVPLAVLAARAAVCVGSSYVALRGISTDQPRDVVVTQIAVALGTCVTGGGAAVIRDAILRYPTQVATALRGVGLGGLAAVLEGDTPQ